MTLYSPFFILAFLPLSAAVYNKMPCSAKSTFLCVINLAFYIFASGKHFVLLPFLALLVYAISFIGKKGFYICLFLLVLLHFAGVSEVGVSFFILRSASYIYDGHREKNFLKVFAFLLFFPCIHAGPLARYKDFEKDFNRDMNYSRIARGICLFLVGALKKLFFADPLFSAFDLFFSASTTLSAFFALICYALYIYFDFSGCSDMARGIALMFGFEIPKNFDFPYMSKSVGEFFRRWHITLGRWLFDYIYVPLGGSKCGRARMVFALFVSWLVSALWHGFAFSYLLWGMYFFLLCTAEKLFLQKGKRVGRLTTLLLVLLGWVLFFSNTPLDAFLFYKRLFAFGDVLLYSRADIYNTTRYLPFIMLSALCASPVLHSVFCTLYKKVRVLVYVSAPIAAVLALSCLVIGGHKPFLYATF